MASPQVGTAPERVFATDEWAEVVVELVRIDDRPDRLDAPLEDVENHHVEEPAVVRPDERARLTVDGDLLDAEAVGRNRRSKGCQQADHLVAAIDRLRQRRAVAAAVPVDDDVGGEDVDQGCEVAVLDGGEEALGEPLGLGLVGVEAGAACLDLVRARWSSWRQ